MLANDKFEVFDGDDLVLQTVTANVFSNKLKLNDFLGVNLEFNFLNSEPEKGKRDIEVTGDTSLIKIFLSSKIRNALGGGSTNPVSLLKDSSGRELLFSVYASKMGDNSDGLNVTLTFYERKHG